MIMNKIIYRIKFFSNWHTGTGLSAGASADLLVNKDEEGLPFIPGKTLKGLLREAAESIHSLDNKLIPSEFITEIFGTRIEESNADRMYKEAGAFFSNAVLPGKTRMEILGTQKKEDPGLKKYLFANISSTAIDEDGIAKDKSLRTIETTVPITLYAEIRDIPVNEDFTEYMNLCFKWIKRIGLNRNRGLGRCEISPYKNN